MTIPKAETAAAYVSDRVYDGTRPLSARLAASLRNKATISTDGSTIYLDFTGADNADRINAFDALTALAALSERAE